MGTRDDERPQRPENPRARRRRRLVVPFGHLALATAVGLTLGAGPAPVVELGQAPSHEVRLPTATERARDEQARLVAEERAAENAERAEALALARAAVAAGEEAVALAQQEAAEVDVALLEQLREARDVLSAVAGPAPLAPGPLAVRPDVDPTGPRTPALDVVPPALLPDVDPADLVLVSAPVGPPSAAAEPPPAAQLPAPDRAPEEMLTPVDVPDASGPDDPAVATDALEGAAQRLFALSFQVEEVVRTVTDQDVARAQQLTSLEQLATAATTLPQPLPLVATVPVTTAVDDPWANGRIPLDALCAPETAPAALLRCDAAAAFDRLSAAYRAEHGTDLAVTSAYRSFEEQAGLRQVLGWLAAPPGASNHGRGVAVDLAGMGGLGQFDAPAYLWMREHAPAFGWHHPVEMRPGGGAPPEPWHWEFGGATTAGE